jgi:hypothetical protein
MKFDIRYRRSQKVKKENAAQSDDIISERPLTTVL